MIADKGLIGGPYQGQIRAHTFINLQTPSRSNRSDPRGKDCNRWLTSTRRLVETVIGQLTEQFNIEKIRARDAWHLTNRIVRKILAHTLAAWVNKSMGYLLCSLNGWRLLKKVEHRVNLPNSEGSISALLTRSGAARR